MQIENYGGKGLHIFSLYIQSTWYSSECDESLKKQYFLPIFIFCLTLQNIGALLENAEKYSWTIHY
jgi:hypothetical protein